MEDGGFPLPHHAHQQSLANVVDRLDGNRQTVGLADDHRRGGHLAQTDPALRIVDRDADRSCRSERRRAAQEAHAPLRPSLSPASSRFGAGTSQAGPAPSDPAATAEPRARGARAPGGRAANELPGPPNMPTDTVCPSWQLGRPNGRGSASGSCAAQAAPARRANAFSATATRDFASEIASGRGRSIVRGSGPRAVFSWSTACSRASSASYICSSEISFRWRSGRSRATAACALACETRACSMANLALFLFRPRQGNQQLQGGLLGVALGRLLLQVCPGHGRRVPQSPGRPLPPHPTQPAAWPPALRPTPPGSRFRQAWASIRPSPCTVRRIVRSWAASTRTLIPPAHRPNAVCAGVASLTTCRQPGHANSKPQRMAR